MTTPMPTCTAPSGMSLGYHASFACAFDSRLPGVVGTTTRRVPVASCASVPEAKASSASLPSEGLRDAELRAFGGESNHAAGGSAFG